MSSSFGGSDTSCGVNKLTSSAWSLMVLDLHDNTYKTDSEIVCVLNTHPFSHPVSLPHAVSPVDHTQHLAGSVKKRLEDGVMNTALLNLLAINRMSSTFFTRSGSNWTPSLK